MRSAKIAEWVLARWTTREHAAAIVGDLMEGAPGAFWWAVVRTAARLAWRSGAGWVLAMVAFTFLVWALNQSARMPHGISRTGVAFGWVTMCFAMVLGYSVPRYGPADRMTQLAAALALAGGVGVCFRWVPGVVPGCVGLATAAVACGVAMPEGRQALAALTASLAAMLVWWRLGSALVPGRFTEQPPWVRNAGYLLFVGTVVWFPVFTASRVRALLDRRARRRTVA